MPNDTEASTGTIPPKNVPTTGINWERIPADIPNATGEGKPIRAKAIVNTILAKIAKITLATINPPAFETPIVQTWSIAFEYLSSRDSFKFILQCSPSYIK